MSTTVQWLNSNRYRSYPLREDDTSLYSNFVDSTFTLPDDFILDVSCTAYIEGELNLFIFARNAHEMVLGFRLGTTYIGDIYIPIAAALPYTTRLCTHTADLTVVIGEGLNTLLPVVWSPHLLTSAIAQFEPALTVYQDRHRVASLCGDTDDSEILTGDIHWEDGYGLQIVLHQGAGTLQLLAEPGAGLGYPCERQDPDRAVCSELLTSINGLNGDGASKFQLGGGNGISVTPDPDNHTLIVQTQIEAEDIDCGGA